MMIRSITLARALLNHLPRKRLISKFSHTSVFMQNGLKIRELPMVVEKVNNILNVEDMNHNGNKTVSLIHTAQDREIMEEINQMVSVNGLFKMLEMLPTGKVTSPVAVHCLKRIIHINNARKGLIISNRNFEAASETRDENEGSFLRFAFINMLLDIVYRSQDPRVILDGLRVVCQDNFFHHASDQEIVKYKERMYEETVAFITKGMFNLIQVCEAIMILTKFHPDDKKRSLEMADRLWAGILDQTSAGQPLDTKSVVAVFRTLPCLSQSRDLIYQVVSNKACDLWTQFTTKDILEILRVLNIMGTMQCSNCQQTTLSMISQWSLVNVHNLNEQELLALVVCMDKMDFMDKNFVWMLEKYMKARGVHIKEADLVAATCDYCDHQKLISVPILDASAEYFVDHVNTLNIAQFNSIAKVFGHLNMHPSTGFKFWDKLETRLEQIFSVFPPSDVIQLLLSFVYLGKFPVHFASKIFSPVFFDKLESSLKNQETTLLPQLYGDIDVLLASLRLEANLKISGGYLISKRSKEAFRFESSSTVGMSLKTTQNILPFMATIVGDINRIRNRVFIEEMPQHALYQVDLMVYPSAAESLMMEISKQKRSHLLVLIQLPQHYVGNKKHLNGRQAMRIRQFKKLGYKVMLVDAVTVRKLLVMPAKLQEYLQQSYDKALVDK